MSYDTRISKTYLYFPISHRNIETCNEERKDAQNNGANLAQRYREGSFHIWLAKFQANERQAKNNSVTTVEDGFHLNHDMKIEQY
jgi:hypothetical protein